MHSIQPQSLTDSELLRLAHNQLGASTGLPLAWQLELVRRLEQRADEGAARDAVVDSRQLSLF